jgi:hypothetical protein
MLKALLHGKLSRPDQGLLPFLALARAPDSSCPLCGLADPVAAKVTYWPWWQCEGSGGCEPDCVVDLRAADGRRYVVAVEAKYLSGKSSWADDEVEAPVDQLAREWDNLVQVSGQANATPVLVYLTADAGFPRREIAASIGEYRSKRPECGEPLICWLSWCHLAGVVEGQDNPILADLAAMLVRLGLHFFRGISPVKVLTRGLWGFRMPEATFRWQALELAGAIRWEFRQ